MQQRWLLLICLELVCPACTQALNYNVFKAVAGAPAIKSQELLKLQMSSAQAEAKQLALMEVLLALYT